MATRDTHKQLSVYCTLIIADQRMHAPEVTGCVQGHEISRLQVTNCLGWVCWYTLA